LPNLTLPAEEKNIVLGRFDTEHRNWLKENKPGLYSQLMLVESLFEHCKEVENRANEMLYDFDQQMAKSEGITEQLKANDQMAWVGAMNNIRHRVSEIVFEEVIYCV